MSSDKYKCPVQATIAIIGGKWKIVILYILTTEKTCRFNKIRKAIPAISHKILTQQLRELEEHGLVSRQIYPEVPPKVEYSLTPKGESLKPILKSICEWGTRNLFQDYAGNLIKPTKHSL